MTIDERHTHLSIGGHHLSSFVFLFATLFSPYAAHGANLEVAGNAIEGFEVLSPSATEFQTRVQELVPDPAAREALGVALSYSVILVNLRDARLLWLATRLACTGKDHQMKSMNQLIGLSGIQRKYVLITPDAGLTNTLLQGRMPQALPDLKVRVGRIDEFCDHAAATVSVDGIVRETGEFDGPDLSRAFESLVARAEATVNFVNIIRAILSSDTADQSLISTLEDISSKQVGAMTSQQQREAAMQIKVYANTAYQIVRKHDFEALNRYLVTLDNVARRQAVWKKK